MELGYARIMRRAIGVVIVGVAAYLVMQPLVVADVLGRPHDTSTQMINLRASWGGTLAGLGGFIAWLPGLRPWKRTVVGLVTWAMAGIGLARLIGFALDGDPDTRQYIWITAEVVLAVGGAAILKTFAKAWK